MLRTNRRTDRWLLVAITVTAFCVAAVAVLLVTRHNPATVATTAGARTNSPPGATPTAATSTATPSQPPPAEPAPSLPTTAAVTASPHFNTPQAAMIYLAAAWNSNNPTDLDHVTNPAARAALGAMHDEAVNLRLDHCTPRPQGDYLCYFDHDYPPGTATTLPGGLGHAVFVVGPALLPGWYMTVLEHCG